MAELLSVLENWEFVDGGSVGEDAKTNSDREIWRDGLGLIISLRNESVASHYILNFSDTLVIEVMPDRRRIVTPSTSLGLSQLNVDHMLADQVAPRVLAHDGTLVVHAGAFRVGNQAILIIGKSGSGKSTLAASFAGAGYDLLGDDALIISWNDGEAVARAVYPSLRLLPDSLAALLPDSHSTTPVANYGSKRRLSVPVESEGAPGPLPVAATFVLGPPATDGQVHIEPLSVAATCMALVANSFALDPTDPDRAALRLHGASALANKVPAFALSYPHDFARLPEIRTAILATIA